MLDSIEDKSWSLLDWLWDRGIPIGAAFEKYNIPAVLFPLLIILIVLLLAWVLLFSGPAQNQCGNFICDSDENCVTCPLDCGECEINITPGGLIVTVDVLQDQVSGLLEVTLYDASDNMLKSEIGRKQTFEFTGLDPQIVKAELKCPNGKARQSRPREVSPGDSTIALLLPDACFDMGTITSGSGSYGNMIVSVSDSISGAQLDGVSITAVRKADNIPIEDAYSDLGMATLSVPSDNFYYLVANKDGYETFDGSENSFYVIAGDVMYKDVQIYPVGGLPGGSVMDSPVIVCVTASGKPATQGRVAVSEVGGGELASSYLSNADGGCITFSIPAGKRVRASVTSLPSDCATPGFSSSITVSENTNTINIPAVCGNVAYLKVMVHNKAGGLLTESSKVTVWDVENVEEIPGSSPDGSLAIGAGGFTEEIAVPAGIYLQARVTDVPSGYATTYSGPIKLISGEHGTIDIILAESDDSAFDFRGASLIYTPAAPGNPLTVFVQEIYYNDTLLTPENSYVSIMINGEEYPAQFFSQENLVDGLDESETEDLTAEQ